jgi:hypothetical protein
MVPTIYKSVIQVYLCALDTAVLTKTCYLYPYFLRKYARTKNHSNGMDVRWYFFKLPLAERGDNAGPPPYLPPS